MQSAEAVLANAEGSIIICSACTPPRPMVIKSVATSLRGTTQTITFECVACGETLQTSARPSPSDPVRTDAFRREPSAR
jgi:hypothetical protein